MRKQNPRPLTAGLISKRYETLPRIWRPKTSVYRKNVQDVEKEMDISDSGCSSDEEYDSDSTVYECGPRKTGERQNSAESSSTQLSSTIKSEEDLEDEVCPSDDLTLSARLQGISLDTTGCQFGEVPMQFATKRMEMKEPENCHCLANLVHYETNAFGPWKSACRHRIYNQKTSTEQRNSKLCQPPNLQQRLSRNLSKNYIYPFSHFENRSKYIQQYRDLFSSVGKFKKALEFSKENKITNPLPDPYLKRLRSNVCSVAENVDVFAILAVEKNLSKKEELESAGDIYKSMTVNDRGKNLNLAPVRDSPPLEIFPQQFQGKSLNKNIMPFNQYLNLVIPKTTLHRTNIQLNLDNPKDSWTPRFESKRNPSKQSHRRSESVDSHLHSSKNKSSSQSSSRRSSGANRTSELRLERAATSADGARIKKESGYIIPPPPSLSQNTSILTRRKTQIQKTKCVSQIRAMLSDLDDCKGKLDRTCRRLENTKFGPEAKHDRVIPATKPFGIEGQTCRPEDQLSIIHRLRKEKERTMRVSTVN